MSWRPPRPVKWLVVLIVAEWVSAVGLASNLVWGIFGVISNAALMWPSFALCAVHMYELMRLSDPLRAPPVDDANRGMRMWYIISFPKLLFIAGALFVAIQAKAGSWGWSEDFRIMVQFIVLASGLQLLSLFIFRIYRQPAAKCS